MDIDFPELDVNDKSILDSEITVSPEKITPLPLSPKEVDCRKKHTNANGTVSEKESMAVARRPGISLALDSKDYSQPEDSGVNDTTFDNSKMLAIERPEPFTKGASIQSENRLKASPKRPEASDRTPSESTSKNEIEFESSTATPLKKGTKKRSSVDHSEASASNTNPDQTTPLTSKETFLQEREKMKEQSKRA